MLDGLERLARDASPACLATGRCGTMQLRGRTTRDLPLEDLHVRENEPYVCDVLVLTVGYDHMPMLNSQGMLLPRLHVCF